MQLDLKILNYYSSHENCNENGLNRKSSVKLIDEFLKKMTGKGIIIISKNTMNEKEKGTRVELKIPYKIF